MAHYDYYKGCLNHFEGEFFKYEDMDEDLLDTILDEAEFND